MGVYVFALVDQRIRPLRVNGHTIHCVEVGGIFAVLEHTPQPPAPVESALRRQHAIVNAIAARVDAILPARFGALTDLPGLERLVIEHAGKLREAFELVRGREQMTVRVSGLPPIRRRGAAESRETGTSYLRRRARLAAPGQTAPLRAAVASLVAAERIERTVDGVRLAMHHLVPGGSAPRYRRLVGRALATVRPTMDIRVAGPWPPFAFVPSLWP